MRSAVERPRLPLPDSRSAASPAASDSRSSAPDILILGGKTRLAQAVFAESIRAGRRPRVVCRRLAERDELMALYPDEVVVDDSRYSSSRAICIIVCALGLVHPARPDVALHLQNFQDDLRRLSNLAGGAGGDVHIVLVSTVIALIPSRDRAYYAGLKNLTEAAIAALLRDLTSVRLSVVYPGRLVDRRVGLADMLATPYPVLASTLVKMAGSSGASSRVVGLDARLWLLARVGRVLACAVGPTFPSTPLHLRDGLPRD